MFIYFLNEKEIDTIKNSVTIIIKISNTITIIINANTYVIISIDVIVTRLTFLNRFVRL